FSATPSPVQKTQLDQVLQEQVLAGLGGLQAACTGSVNLARTVVMPLIDQAASFLGDQLPATDVAQCELAAAQASGGDLSAQTLDYLARAAPMVAGNDAIQQTSFLLVPASAS